MFEVTVDVDEKTIVWHKQGLKAKVLRNILQFSNYKTPDMVRLYAVHFESTDARFSVWNMLRKTRPCKKEDIPINFEGKSFTLRELANAKALLGLDNLSASERESKEKSLEEAVQQAIEHHTKSQKEWDATYSEQIKPVLTLM